MKLRSKILLAQIPLALALLAISLLAVRTIQKLGGHSQTILKDNYQSVLASQRMKESIERMDSAALFRIAGKRKESEEMAEPNREIFERELSVEEHNITEPGEIEAARALRGGWNKFESEYRQFTALEDAKAQQEFYFSRLYPLFLPVKNSANEILAINQDAMVRKSDRVNQAANRMNQFMMVFTLAAALSGIFFSVYLTRRMLRPLNVLSQAVRRLGEGDLEARALVKGGDEIAQLAGEFNSMADHLDQYRRSSLGDLLQAQLAAQAAIDSLSDPVIIFGIDGAILNVNNAAEPLLAMISTDQAAAPEGHANHELNKAVEQARAYALSGKGAYRPRGYEEAVCVRLPDGDRYYLPCANPLYTMGSGITGAAILLQDVTRLRRFDELKSDMVATVAHEFRTPLTSLRMAIHLCLDETVGALNDKQSDLLFAAREDCERLQSMVDDLLDLSRIQSGRIEMKRVPIAAQSLVDAAIAQHQAAAREKGVALAAGSFLPPDVQALADPDRIQLVLTNFITNAIRHTPAGGQIQVAAEAEDRQVCFTVTDTGEGIAPEYLPKVFDRFFCVPGARSTGVGLGLSICREVIEAHLGKIGAQSVPGRGSAFWFSLPLGAPPSPGSAGVLARTIL
ncbi:MAG: ATP-binding protein [Candidatus Sumerlaeota bacterium]|nr:ATP-binding protein [Candidatus Sumerlaeota bacterium]